MIKGITFSVTASILFGVLYYLSTHLKPLSGEEIYGFRMWVSLPFVISALFIFKKTDEFNRYLKRLKQHPHLILVLLTTTAVTGLQMWLFLYAPNNGYAIDVSIGYLLMPIAMVAVGRFLFNETLSLLKIISIISASVGVFITLITAGSLSWATLMVLIGYPVYFSLRKHFDMSHLSSFVCEIILMLPIATYFMLNTDMQFVTENNPNFYFWLVLLGIVSGTALIGYIMASSLVPINVLGLLSYIEPLAMLIVAFIIGEVLDQSSYILMACLMLSICLLVLDGIITIRKQRRRE
ncbi:EamA family transporter RarD [Glaesserella parasuis]|uniref:DMT superfamily drug/metabolite transporter n=1 Tax=Glaesserella parasuis serovar 5 (strain SH0165) TaxID=557723 RepID=B8F698_GLAP5|nr:EamA family transporter RarD [Glaesserella parasuis]ACL32850.1 DMT superfamily drug/metabolite transporter [Glaesserella parasuis SH0165]EMY46824.1 DMT superfamily drug/metabolite transporter [Glaesserella parasuis gx033]MDG6247420.1 EamA family transporter RarD [Glaesserella parasuis]MDG6362934.1 EamA family transporter RarD [Glaesserella parasuis]MDG6456107.1 EamA family transporter RarD [Glaesserella parasuis]